MDFMIPPFLKSLTFFLLHLHPFSSLYPLPPQLHLKCPYFQLLYPVLSHYQVFCQRHPTASIWIWLEIMWRAGAGGQCGFGEGGWAHSTPGDHSDHCSVPSPGQAESSLLRAGKTLWPKQIFPTYPWRMRGCSILLCHPLGQPSHGGRHSKALQRYPCRSCASLTSHASENPFSLHLWVCTSCSHTLSLRTVVLSLAGAQLTLQHSPQEARSTSHGKSSCSGQSYANGKNIPPRSAFSIYWKYGEANIL